MRHPIRSTTFILAAVFALATSNVHAASIYSTTNEPDRIVILGDSDFCNGTQTGVVNCATADGSAANPYVIGGWSLSASTQPVLVLKDTTKYVIVDGNSFSGSGSPMASVKNVQNLVIENNVFMNAGWIAISVRESNVQVNDNQFTLVGVGVQATDSILDLTGNVYTQVASAVRVAGSTLTMAGEDMSDDYPCEPDDPCYDEGGPGTVGVAARDSSVTIENTDIRLFDSAIYAWQSVMSITGASLHDSDRGIGARDSTVDFHESNLYAVTVGVEQLGTGVVDATNVWWGTPDGPSGDGPGSGASVSGNVVFVPWATIQIETSTSSSMMTLL